MPSSVNQRDEDLARRYLSEDISVARLAIDFSLSEIRVRQILKAQGATAEKRSPTSKMEGDKTFSLVHVRVGQQVSMHRAFTLGVDRSYYANKIGWSTIKLASVEKGTYNLTLIDLQDIARTLDKPLHVLLELAKVAPESENAPDAEPSAGNAQETQGDTPA